MLARHGEIVETAPLRRLHARHAADFEWLELLSQGGAVLRMLDHPGIPRVLETFPAPDGDAPAEL